MDFYGPFTLTGSTVDIFVTRSQPGVVLLCDDSRSMRFVSHSAHDVGEVLKQWIGRFEHFYFCYTETGAHAERLESQLIEALSLKSRG